MHRLEQHLSKQCASSPKLKLLEVQWTLDKLALEAALHTVGTYFPHYSNHNDSHSSKILQNIERILGDRLDTLSATDTWLLLESAYWHDVGMVIDEKTMRGWLQTADFSHHIEELASGKDLVLSEAAKFIQTGTATADRETPADYAHALRLTIAEFGRARHALRSGNAVRAPVAESLSPARAPLADRLFDLLARIVTSHGEDAIATMAIPHQQNGHETDSCHPRLIAFLLRLGDLLDLDNGRFCPHRLAQAGVLPHTSLAHMAKHAATVELNITPTKIDVTANCTPHKIDINNVEVQDLHLQSYETTSDWLEWLKEELSFIASHWSAIAPDDFSAAPSIGTIVARLEPFEVLEAGKRPDFRVDQDYFLELARGTNLYGSDKTAAWTRELLSNAADATMLRAWNRASETEQRIILAATDPLQEFAKLAGTLPIKVTVLREEETFDNEELTTWRIKIEDQGGGMNLDDLRSIQTIGSTKAKTRRLAILLNVPEFAKPTGAFGLGIQSVFMETDEIEIDTRHEQTGDKRIVRLVRPEPSSGRRSGIYIRPGLKLEFGTAVTLRVAKSDTWGRESFDRFADPLGDATERWRKVFQEHCEELLVAVTFNGELLPKQEQSSNDRFTHYDQEEGTVTSIWTETAQRDYSLFRGYFIGNRSQSSGGRLLSTCINLWKGSANDLLNANRENFTSLGNIRYRDLKVTAPHKASLALLESNTGSDELRRRASLLVHTKNPASRNTEWAKLPAGREFPSGALLTIGQVKEMHEVVVVRQGNSLRSTPHRYPNEVPLGQTPLLLTPIKEVHDAILQLFPSRAYLAPVLVHETHPFDGVRQAQYETIHLRKSGEPFSMTDESFLAVLDLAHGRHLILCPSRFRNLHLKPTEGRENLRSAVCPLSFDSHFPTSNSPVDVANLGKVVEYTASQSLNPKATETETLKAVALDMRELLLFYLKRRKGTRNLVFTERTIDEHLAKWL